MNVVLSQIGLSSIVILIIYIIKKVDDYLHLEEEENAGYKIDEDDDEL